MTIRRALLAFQTALLLGASVAHAQTAPNPFTPSVEAVTSKSRARRERSPLTWTVTLGREHDDNVVQMTQASLNLFAIKPGPPRFLIPHVGDWATTGAASLRLSTQFVQRRESRLTFSGSFQHWDRDRKADWQQYGIALGQDLIPSKHHALSGQMWFKHIPYYYLGEITDVDASVAALHRVRNSLIYAQNNLGLGLSQDLMSGRVTFAGSLERESRTYTANFPERDNHNDQWSVGAQLRPLRRGGPTLGVTYQRGDLNARGDVFDTLGVRDQDISYDHHGVEGSLSQSWASGALRGRLDASYLREDRRYLTTDVFDVYRYSRTNHRREATVRVTERLTRQSDVIVTWSRLTSEAHYDVVSLIEPSTTDFRQEKFEVALRSRW